MSIQERKEKCKVLIVESNTENCSQLTEIISPFYEVITAGAEEAVSLISEKPSDIATAILEIRQALPIVKELRGAIPTEKFPVLISTDIDNSELENQLLDLDVTDFIKKPYDKRRVLNRLKTAIKLSQANKAIDELERDELTGLLTRKAFLLKVEQFISHNREKKFCIIAFDFDNFKSSNSLYGVEKCNEFLAYSAREMMKAMPAGISGRYGGDQYILFYEYQEQVDINRLNRIVKLILENAPIPHQIVKMGVYSPVDCELPLVICCDRAFLALNGIKGKYGKNLAFFEETLQNQLLNEQRIIETMERALEEKQFQVFYQPKHETVTGYIAGAEALVRWNHPEYGFMAPGQFIPLFERNGFITKLDCFVVEQVCNDLVRWKQDGLPLVPISINVSRRDFMESGCIDRQLQTIEKYGIDHSLIHMEVTESLYSDNTDLIISKVKEIQNLGFMIEMDDFGSGYSSLGLLSTFPLNVIKLDISFVRNFRQNEIVIENIIKMAHRLGLLTVAEGAETSEQVATLKTLGCDFIQGYYFSKPLALDDYEKYITDIDILEGSKRVQTADLEDSDWHMEEKMLLAANEVAEAVPGGFFSYHADGTLEIISFNKELMNMYGCKTAEEFREYTGNSFKGLVYPDDFEHVQKSIEDQISDTNDIDYVEYRIKAKDGTVKYVKDYGRFVRTKKYGDIFYVFLNDVTEEERWRADAATKLIENMKLEQTVTQVSTEQKAKNIFVDNIIRDLLNPVSTIIECTDAIDANISNPVLVDKKVKEAKVAEEHLLGFINNLNELSQLEKKTVKLIEAPTDISDAAEKIASLIQSAADKKRITIETKAEIYNPYIYQDVVHTTNVVFNIALNAVKYTPVGGKIKLCLKQTPGRNENECFVDFICEDNGIGISKKFLPYVCKPFAREDNKVNAEIPGSGLGLVIAKELLALMSGTITITPKKGKGVIVRTSQPHRFCKKDDIDRDTVLTQNVRL